ncbi:MAG: hypothetical protein FWE62_07060, partial [Firmicutes bacterium]|nr:hypothetical protein [Bacillota bacterium]
SELKDFAGIIGFTASSGALVNQMYDKEKDIRGYYVLNLADPFISSAETVTITFDPKYEYAVIYNRDTVTQSELTNSKLVLTLDEGDSAFIIPY